MTLREQLDQVEAQLELQPNSTELRVRRKDLQLQMRDELRVKPVRPAAGQVSSQAPYRIKDYETEEGWKADHRYMSGSRVAKVVGLSKWGGPLTAYLECTDPQDNEDNEAMKAGRYLEEAVAQWACDDYGLGRPTMNGRAVFIHRDHDFIRVTPDAHCDAGGLEIKTSNTNEWPATDGELREFEPEVDPGLPADVWCQVLLTMEVLCAPHWYVAVLRWGRDLRVYKVPASPKLQTWLVEQAVSFWHDHVLSGIPPQPTEADARPDESGLLTQRLFPRENKGESFSVNDELTAHWARQWVEASDVESKAKASKELAAMQLSQRMTTHETMLVKGNKFTWKTNKWGNRTFRGPREWKTNKED